LDVRLRHLKHRRARHTDCLIALWIAVGALVVWLVMVGLSGLSH